MENTKEESTGVSRKLSIRGVKHTLLIKAVRGLPPNNGWTLIALGINESGECDYSRPLYGVLIEEEFNNIRYNYLMGALDLDSVEKDYIKYVEACMDGIIVHNAPTNPVRSKLTAPVSMELTILADPAACQHLDTFDLVSDYVHAVESLCDDLQYVNTRSIKATSSEVKILLDASKAAKEYLIEVFSEDTLAIDGVAPIILWRTYS